MDMQDQNHYDVFIDRVCPVCGKTFIPAPFHIYKVNNVKVCTYSCQLKGERENLKPTNLPYVKAVDLYTLDGVFVKSFPNAVQAAREMNVQAANIRKCCRGQNKSAYGFIWKYRQEQEAESE